ncbi:MAG: hypothetical protein HY314_09610 [Acidobacteria bacterium]|nr:hypothetical protein [Acidobacteriota bacterium]
MLTRIIIKSQPYGLSLVLVLVWVAVALGGGFQITVETPSSTDPELKGAVLVVRTFGCYQPTDAALSGTAEGLVNGRRQSMPIQLTPTSKGIYAIKQQWPAQGVWVLAITGTYRGLTSSALVELGPNGKVQAATGKGSGLPVQIVSRKLSAGEIEAALKNLASKVNQKTRASAK